MFVRFRQQGSRLQASLMQTRRAAGKMVTEHIASLGSVDADVSIRERLAFWSKLPERLARLGNRVGPEEHGKIYGALHARIPMVTPDDQREVQKENAETDARVWDALHGAGASLVDGHKSIIANAERSIAENAEAVAQADEWAKAARSRVERIRRGEAVEGGFGKPRDLEAELLAAGFSRSFLRRARLWNSLSEDELKLLFQGEVAKRRHEAHNKATDREVRRIIRARQ